MTLLPSTYTKKQVHAKYVDHMKETLTTVPDTQKATLKVLTSNSFLRLWSRDRRHYRIATEATDFCDVCAKFYTLKARLSAGIQRARTQSEKDRVTAIETKVNDVRKHTKLWQRL